ncbi:VUT family protein [Sutterella sp.]|uniref:VUT family protein n=1 Tax=Sutterella sp. TaxID=1981025 RepID=UPI0026DFDC4F|nr:VUT family protein [Sutterella sp.]MDO5530650.1 VUT family protein [Sutterella sp.]
MALSRLIPSERTSQLGLVTLLLFILTIPLGNWVVMNVGLVCDPNGPCLIPVWPGVWSPSAVMLAGLALVLRDAVQNLLGNRAAVWAILAGTALSAVLAEPSIVIGSAAAFLFSELADFAVYTPMRKRWPSSAVILSGLVGSAVDSAIFLSLAFGSLDYLFGQVLGKFWMSLLGGAVLWWFRHRRTAPAETHAAGLS